MNHSPTHKTQEKAATTKTTTKTMTTTAMAPPPNMETAEVVAGAIQAQGVAVAAAITDAAQLNLAEIWE